MTLEVEFQIACEAAVRECRRPGYVPRAWIAMMERHGAVGAAKRLIASGDLQAGLLRLLNLGRADLTVEHAVLHERWHELFDDQDRENAAWRLCQAHGERRSGGDQRS